MLRKRFGHPPGRRIWVLFHCQVLLEPGTFYVDEALYFVATSRSIVKRYFQALQIQDGTWWQVGWGRLNDYPLTIEGSRLYSPDGIEIETSPVKNGYRIALQRTRKEAEQALQALRNARQEGRPKGEILRCKRHLQRTRWRLKGHPISASRAKELLWKWKPPSAADKKFISKLFSGIFDRRP